MPAVPNASGAPAPTPATPPAGSPAEPQAPQQADPRREAQARRQGRRAGAPAPKDDGFRGRFATVPDEHWSLLEPHLKTVQGHVTQLEQKYAPFKDYSPEQVSGLASFAQNFEQNPLGMWMTIAEQLQKNGVIHPELDLEALSAYAQGQFDDEEGQPQVPGQPQTPDELAQLRAELDELKQERTTEQQRQQQQAEDRLLQNQISTLRTNLTSAGLPEDTLTDELLVTAMITHNGNAQAAEKSLLDFRTSVLRGFTEGGEENELEMPNGVPGRGTRPKAKTPRDAFGKANIGAEQFLKQNLKAEAQ